MSLTYSYHHIQMFLSHISTYHYFSGVLKANKWHLFTDIYFDIDADSLDFSDSINIDSSNIKSMDVFVTKFGFQIDFKFILNKGDKGIFDLGSLRD